MNISHLAPRAIPGGALSRRASAIATAASQLAGIQGGKVHALLKCLVLVSVGLAATVSETTAAGVDLEWDANPETDISGYKVSYGTSSGVYPNVVDVGTNPSTSISDLTEGTTYYFAVSAVNESGLQSSLSSEIFYQIPVTPPINQVPVASAASVATDEDILLPITLRGTDPENSSLTYSIATPPAKGTLSGTPPNLTYSPSADYHGNDSFTFYVSDGTLNSATATVSITITAVNDPPVAHGKSATTNEDTPVAITLSGMDIENSPLTFSIVSGPTKGTLTGTAPNLNYLPSADYNGNDSFTYRVSDGAANSENATVSITVTAVNDPPVAHGKSATTAENTPVAITLSGTDIEKSPLTFSIISGPTKGTLTGTAPNLTYSPVASSNGSDSFTYRVSDGTAVSGDATVSITVTTVNDQPIANSQSVNTSEDTPLPIVLGGNDKDLDPLTFTVIAGPTKGTLTGTPPDLTYTPSKDYHGSDQFTFVANDGTADSPLATISIAVSASNDAPVALAASYKTAEDAPIEIEIVGTDPEGATLNYTIVTGPTHGSLAGTPPNVTYSPVTNYHGPDSFTFMVNDGTLNSQPATVSISVTPVNDVPVAAGKAATTDEDTPVAITLSGTDTENNPLTFTIVNGPAKGTLSGTAPNLIYSPGADLSGNDSFTYQVNDGAATSGEATVSITIRPVNDEPVANSKSVNTTEDTALPIVLGGSDKDLNPLTFTVIAGPSKGTLSGTPPNLTYNPAKNFNGSDQFTFVANDGTVDSPLATISIVVSASNDAPVALAATHETEEDTPLEIEIGGTDPEGATLDFTIVTGPTHGSLAGTPPNVIYSPSPNYNGPDNFTFLVTDGTTNSQPATVSLVVNPVNDAPVANSLAVETPADSPRAIVLTGSDPEVSSLKFTVVDLPTKGILSGTPPNLSYQPNADATGRDQFTFTSGDGSLTSSPATVSIEITPVTIIGKNLAPAFTLNPISLSGNEGASIGGQLAASDPNAGDVLSITKISGPAWLGVSSTGMLSGTPQSSNTGINNFVVRVTDSSGAFAEAPLNITINALANTGDIDDPGLPVNRRPVFTGNPVFAGDASENAYYDGQSLAGKAIDYDPGDTLTYWKVGGPDWLVIGTDGQLYGTPPPNSAGMNSFHIRAADSSLATVDTELRIQVVGLPLPWRTSDIGTGQWAGHVSFFNGAYTQTGSGAFGGVSDQTRYTYQTLSGDGSILAKVSLDRNAGPDCYAGIMIRESMAPKAREVFIGLGNDSSYRLVKRLKAGRKASVQGIARNPGPDTWVRLTRSAKKRMIYAFKSSDGVNWTYLGGTKIAMAGTCHIGLAVSSGSNPSQTTASFSSVWVDP